MAKNREELEVRVIRAAEAALGRQQYVSAIDVLCGMRLLQPTHVDQWRKGRIDFLERMIQGNLGKISSSMQMFHRWAQQQGLKPSETAYMRGTRSGTMPLQFSKSGDPGIEKRYRTHYLSRAMKERRNSSNFKRSPAGLRNLSYSRSCATPNARNADRILDKESFLLMEAQSSRSAFKDRGFFRPRIPSIGRRGLDATGDEV